MKLSKIVLSVFLTQLTIVGVAQAICTPSSNTLCLAGGRFAASLSWSDGAALRDGFVAQPRTSGQNSSAGIFYFFQSDPSNWEILVKMIDGCPTNGKYWVLVSASTGFQWTLTITDTVSGAVRTFSHPLDGRAAGIATFEAFNCGGSGGCCVGFLCDSNVEGCDCGGFLAKGCAAPLVCQYAFGTCGQGDAPGTCVRPDPSILCPAVVDPVCACNGVTYGNSCDAGRDGVSIAFRGECP